MDFWLTMGSGFGGHMVGGYLTNLRGVISRVLEGFLTNFRARVLDGFSVSRILEFG